MRYGCIAISKIRPLTSAKQITDNIGDANDRQFSWMTRALRYFFISGSELENSCWRLSCQLWSTVEHVYCSEVVCVCGRGNYLEFENFLIQQSYAKCTNPSWWFSWKYREYYTQESFPSRCESCQGIRRQWVIMSFQSFSLETTLSGKAELW